VEAPAGTGERKKSIDMSHYRRHTYISIPTSATPATIWTGREFPAERTRLSEFNQTICFYQLHIEKKRQTIRCCVWQQVHSRIIEDYPYLLLFFLCFFIDIIKSFTYYTAADAAQFILRPSV
jgi:hypothetical protein